LKRINYSNKSFIITSQLNHERSSITKLQLSANRASSKFLRLSLTPINQENLLQPHQSGGHEKSFTIQRIPNKPLRRTRKPASVPL